VLSSPHRKDHCYRQSVSIILPPAPQRSGSDRSGSSCSDLHPRHIPLDGRRTDGGSRVNINLEQRIEIRCTRRLQFFEQRRKGKLLVRRACRVISRTRSSNARKERSPDRWVRNASTFSKKPTKRLALHRWTIGSSGPVKQILLPAVAIEQCLQGLYQDHLQADVFTLAECLYCLAQRLGLRMVRSSPRKVRLADASPKR